VARVSRCGAAVAVTPATAPATERLTLDAPPPPSRSQTDPQRAFAIQCIPKITLARSAFSDASLRDGDERARHLLRNALHSTGAYADFAGNFVDAFTCAQLLLYALFNLFAYARPTQRLTGFYGPL
jgi:hypothetical protein